MALHSILQQKSHRVISLLTTITDEYDRISMHGVQRLLLERQAESIGFPLHKVFLPPQCTNVIYETRMEQALGVHLVRGVRHVGFGDIFLEDLRAYREQNLARMGMSAVFPIWKRDTRDLASSFLELGFRAVAVCVDLRILDASFAGRFLDAAFFRDLPPGADPCGENGEFHTFVFDGPIFKEPVRFSIGEKVVRDSFCFCDLVPNSILIPRRK